MTKKEREAFTKGFYAGFRASGEGWNGEYPFADHCRDVEEDESLKQTLEEALKDTK